MSINLQDIINTVLYSVIFSPLDETNIKSHGYAIELASTLLKAFNSYFMDHRLEQIVHHVCQEIGRDLTYDTFIFPFLINILVVGSTSQSERFPAFLGLLGQFQPTLEQIVFDNSEYIDACLPDANKEFGCFGNSTDVKAPEVASIVTVDTNQAERKAFALDALIYLYEFDSKREMLVDMKKEIMQSRLVALCQHCNSTLRHHAVCLIHIPKS